MQRGWFYNKGAPTPYPYETHAPPKRALPALRQHKYREILLWLPVPSNVGRGDSILGATKVSFSVSGMGSTCAYSFEASQQDMKLLAVGDDGAYNPADKKVHTRQKKIDSTPDVFPDLVKKLFLKLHVADWKKRHFLEARDGTHWRLRIDLAEARYPLVISGSDAYPPYYERLLNLLRPFFHEQGLPFEGD